MTEQQIEAAKNWLIAHKAETEMSWAELYKATGMSTAISAWVGDKYPGDKVKLAEGIVQYQARLAAIAEVAFSAPTTPGFFETPATKRFKSILNIAMRGRMTLIGGAPGCSKTETIRQFREMFPNSVRIVTVDPTTAGVNTMLQALLLALRVKEIGGTPFTLRQRAVSALSETGCLIIFDNAHWLSEKALETISAIYDEFATPPQTPIGVCLVGNSDVLERLVQSSRREAMARFKSRIANQIMIDAPSEADALALAAAWRIDQKRLREYLVQIAKRGGGLRNCTMVLETAFMLAGKHALTIEHLVDSWTHLSAQRLAA